MPTVPSITETVKAEDTPTPAQEVVSPTVEVKSEEEVKQETQQVTVTSEPQITKGTEKETEPTSTVEESKPTEAVKEEVTETPAPTEAEEDTEIVSANSLDEFAENLDDSMFDSKQLIIISNTSEFENYGAVEIQNYESIYVLSYESNSATKSAYTKIKADNAVSSVEINEALKVNAENLAEETKKPVAEKTELGKYLDGLSASKSVKVAILDTGLNPEGLDGRYEDTGVNYAEPNNTSSLTDSNGHGTEMAKLILENSNDLVKIVPIKVADSQGKASVLNTYLGIKKAIECGVNVINISMTASVSTTSQLLTEAINEANSKGIIVVVSAGNLGIDVSNVSPANVVSALVVSAVNSDNTFASYSNYGNTVDYTSYGSYNGKTGTSYSAARVSGIIADLLSKQGNLETLDKYAIDLGNEGSNTQFGRGLLALENPQGSSEEEEADKIAKENKEKYENLCSNWKGMTDEELNSALEGLSETLRGFFLRGLSDSELEELLKKDTLLVEPLNMTKAIIVDNIEDIPSTPEESDVKSYDMAYKYYLELTEDLEISATNRVWTNGGEFYFNFSGSENKSYNGTITITLTNIDFNKAGSSDNSDAQLTGGKYNGSTAYNVTWSGSVTGFALGTPYLIRQDTSNTEGAKTNWVGIYLVGMKFGVPQYHKVESVKAVNVETTNNSRFGFFKRKNDATGKDVSGNFVGDIKDKNSTVETYFQANAYNIGLDNAVGKHNATMNVTFKRPTYKVTYHRNTKSSDTTTHVVSKVKYGELHELISISGAGFSNTGYKFSTWAINSADSTTTKAPGKSITVNGNREVYAVWVKNTPTPTNTPKPTATKAPSATPIPQYTITYKYYMYDANTNEWEEEPFATEGPQTYNKGTEISLDSIDGRANAKTPEGYEFNSYKLDSVNGSSLESACTNGKYKLEKNTVVCICYTPLKLNLTIDTKDGVYSTAADERQTENLGLKFTYGVEKEFSSKDINNYVEVLLSLEGYTKRSIV